MLHCMACAQGDAVSMQIVEPQLLREEEVHAMLASATEILVQILDIALRQLMHL